MKPSIEPPVIDSEQITERMRVIRSSAKRHVVELQVEAKRLVDWKEYARAKPILSVATAGVLGFLLIRTTTRMVSRSTSPSSDSVASIGDSKSLFSAVTKSLSTIATNVASNAIKSYMASLIERGNAERVPHDRLH